MRVKLPRPQDTARRWATSRIDDVASMLARWAAKGTGGRRWVVALVDSRGRFLRATCPPLSTVGTVPLAEVFQLLIIVGSVRFYVARCDASRSPVPSERDFSTARRLADLGAALGIELSDLLILGPDGSYHSLREHGQAVAAWHDEALRRAIRADPALARHVARVRAAHARRRPVPSLTRAHSLRVAMWTCTACHRRQAQRTPVCRYCGAARTVH